MPDHRSPGDDPVIDAVARHLRRPIDLGAEVDARVLRELRRSSRADLHGSSRGGVWHWLCRPRVIAVSPLQLIGGLAALLVVALGGARLLRDAPAIPSQEVRFTLAMPGSSHVALVGDFNDWDPSATPLARTGPAEWAVTVPLEPGRYRSTFVVDRSRWVADPAGPAAPDDFGEPTSVITVTRN